MSYVIKIVQEMLLSIIIKSLNEFKQKKYLVH